jgi:hypothetical protein
MNTKRILFALIACALLAAGCSRGTAPSAPQEDPNRAAIRAALEKYLASRGTLDLAAMEMDIKQISFTGDRAEAQVEFRAKGGSGAMQMAYTLERQGGVWTVKESRSPGMQTVHPPVGEPAVPKAGELPASHPPITTPKKK